MIASLAVVQLPSLKFLKSWGSAACLTCQTSPHSRQQQYRLHILAGFCMGNRHAFSHVEFAHTLFPPLKTHVDSHTSLAAPTAFTAVLPSWDAENVCGVFQHYLLSSPLAVSLGALQHLLRAATACLLTKYVCCRSDYHAVWPVGVMHVKFMQCIVVYIPGI